MQNEKYQTQFKNRLAIPNTKIVEPVEEDPNTPKAPEGQIILTGHVAKLYADWTATHSKEEKAPVIQDPVTKETLWVNRKQRRRFAAQARSNPTFANLIHVYTKTLEKTRNRAKSKVQKTSRRINRQAA